MRITIKENATRFSRPLVNLPFGYTIRVEAINITNNPHPPYVAVKNKFFTAFYMCRNSCKPIFHFNKLPK